MNSGDLKTYKYFKISKLNFFSITILSLHSICSESNNQQRFNFKILNTYKLWLLLKNYKQPYAVIILACDNNVRKKIRNYVKCSNDKKKKKILCNRKTDCNKLWLLRHNSVFCGRFSLKPLHYELFERSMACRCHSF